MQKCNNDETNHFLLSSFEIKLKPKGKYLVLKTSRVWKQLWQHSDDVHRNVWCQGRQWWCQCVIVFLWQKVRMTGSEGLTKLRQRHWSRCVEWSSFIYFSLSLTPQYWAQINDECLTSQDVLHTQINEPACINHKCKTHTTHWGMLMQTQQSNSSRNKPCSNVSFHQTAWSQ